MPFKKKMFFLNLKYSICSIYQKSLSITGKFICQTRCKVIIKDVDLKNNKLVNVGITVGGKIYEYLPCQQQFGLDHLDNFHKLHMNVVCPPWNEGKYMKNINSK